MRFFWAAAGVLFVLATTYELLIAVQLGGATFHSDVGDICRGVAALPPALAGGVAG